MASSETRDVVKRYELHHNALLAALQPGGALAEVEVKGPCEALLVPRQVSLEAIHILPFLLAGPQRPTVTSPHSPAPPLSDLFGEGHDTPDRRAPQSSANPLPNREGGPSGGVQLPPSPSSAAGLTYAPENATAFRVALMAFLEFHLLHFDSHGNSEFTTLRGQRGAFSDDLDHVKRFGHIGRVAVLADADPLQRTATLGNNGASASPSAAGVVAGQEKTLSPTSLQIFIIDRPLMDADEARHIVDTLRKLTQQESNVEKVKARLDALFSSPQTADGSNTNRKGTGARSPQQQQRKPTSNTAEPPFPLNIGSTLHRAASITTALISPDARPPPASLLDAASDNESIAETIIIDDFEEDAPDEPDLAPYVSKYARISERQRQRSNTRRASDGVTPLPVSGTVDPYSGRSVTQVTAHVVGAPPSSVTTSRAESSNDHSASGRVRAVPAMLISSTPKTGKAATAPPPAAAASAASAAPQTQGKVLRHQYSRECIKDYRLVVAADNEISYHAFERLMALRCSAPIANAMSAYVSKNQQLQQPILNNLKYNKFIESCHTMMEQIPHFANNVRRKTVLYEGIERYVTTRLYYQIYNVCEDERQQNKMLQSKFMLLENLTAEQLEALPEVEQHHVWGQAMFELDGMDFFKSPREKLRCGMRACELLSLAVSDILRQRRSTKRGAADNAGATAVPPNGVALAFGADEFLPCFLLLTLRACPLNYVQNITYIEKFRCARLMAQEEAYCFATMQSAMMYWLNCREDGSMPSAPSLSHATPAPQGAARAAVGQPELTQHTATADEVTTTSAATAPMMTERDLLPSVRQASHTARAQEATRADGTSLTDGTVVAQGESPTVLDVLFGWANRSLAPLADEIGLGSGSRKGSTSDASGNFSPGDAASPSPQASASSAPAASPWRVMQAFSIGAPWQHSSRDVEVAPVTAGGGPSAPRQVPQPDANTRALVRELLVTQRKPFEQLTLTEIQMVVEEARQLLIEKK